MKSDYRIRATKFLQSILPYIIDNLYDENAIPDLVEKYNLAHHRKVLFSMGSSRMALITSDYVIKWDYDEDNVEDIGGCVDEYNAFLQAKDDGYDYLLAETTLISMKGCLFSIMPRIENIGPMHHKGEIEDYLNKDELIWINNFCTDMHGYNWGIRHNKVCIIDYAFSKEVLRRRNEDQRRLTWPGEFLIQN